MLNAVFAKLQKPYLDQDTMQDIAWSDTLSEMTELEALIATKDKITQIDFLHLKGLEDKVGQVLNLDQFAYRNGKKLAYNYLIKFKKDKESQHDTYVVACEYYRQLYTAYSHIFSALQSNNSRKLESETLKLFLARYLNAIFMMMKWRYFNHQPAAMGVWANVHKIIKTAEELALMNKSFLLYDFQVKETSIAAILERGFMLDTLHQGHYSALEIELTDRVLKVWSANPIMTNAYKENQYQFFVSLENDRGPERLEAKRPHTESCYWSTTRLIDLMESYLCAADMRKSVAEFGLEQIAPSSKIIRLFKKLRLDWHAEAYSRQRRSEERSKKNNLLNIHYGFEAIHDYLMTLQMQYLQKSNNHGEFTFDLQSAVRDVNRAAFNETKVVSDTENWWMVDESSSGFAIDFGRKVPAWAEIGMLVCYSEPGYQSTFNIAEIRSVRKVASGAYRAGFRKVSQNTAAVNVRQMGAQDASAEATTDNILDDGHHVQLTGVFPGLLIDNDVMGKPKLLVPLAQFVRGATYTIAVGERLHQVKAAKVVSKFNDWVLFEVLSND